MKNNTQKPNENEFRAQATMETLALAAFFEDRQTPINIVVGCISVLIVGLERSGCMKHGAFEEILQEARKL